MYRIDDPDAQKPDDWYIDIALLYYSNYVKMYKYISNTPLLYRDEDEPMEIPDPDAVKPDLWLDDEPQYIPDPTATKADDWFVMKLISLMRNTQRCVFYLFLDVRYFFIDNDPCRDTEMDGEWEPPLIGRIVIADEME